MDKNKRFIPIEALQLWQQPTFQTLLDALEGLRLQCGALYSVADLFGCDDELAELQDAISNTIEQVKQHREDLSQ